MLTADRQYGTSHDWLLTFNNTSQVQNKDKVIFCQDKCGKTMIYSTLVTAVSKFIDFAQNYICECKFIKILSLKIRHGEILGGHREICNANAVNGTR